jgi:MscS family membrane protein
MNFSQAVSVLQENWFLVPNWKWIGLGLTILSSLLLLSLSSQFLERFKKRMTQNERLSDFLKVLLEEPLHRPVAWVVALLFFSFAFDVLEFHGGITKFIVTITQIAVMVFAIRIGYIVVDAIGKFLQFYALKGSGLANSNAMDAQLTKFATQTLKVVIIILGVLVALQTVGVNVASVLAGLGLGGLALALAAQETVANFFGSVMIILDKPFKKGDHIKVGDTEGFVEEVGFRSTRIRTFYNSLITIPNATMAKEKIDNLGERPSRRIRHTIGIECETPLEKIKTFTDQIRQSLIRHNMIEKETIVVNFTAIGDFDLKILINFYIKSNLPEDEFETQEFVLFEIMELAARLQINFAYPTQTIIKR